MSWTQYAVFGGLAYITGAVTAPILGAVGAGIFIQKKLGNKKVVVIDRPPKEIDTPNTYIEGQQADSDERAE